MTAVLWQWLFGSSCSAHGHDDHLSVSNNSSSVGSRNCIPNQDRKSECLCIRRVDLPLMLPLHLQQYPNQGVVSCLQMLWVHCAHDEHDLGAVPVFAAAICLTQSGSTHLLRMFCMQRNSSTRAGRGCRLASCLRAASSVVWCVFAQPLHACRALPNNNKMLRT